MDDPKTLRTITTKLPQYLIDHWRRRADDIEEHGSKATYEDLVEFVTKGARVASNAAFGQHMYETQQKKSERLRLTPQTYKQKPMVAATRPKHGVKNRDGPPRRECGYCGREGHQVTECHRLAEVPWPEKRDFVMRMALCLSCLKQGHRNSECRWRATCRTCNRRHPTSLHRQVSAGEDEHQQLQQQEQPGSQQRGQVCSANVTSWKTAVDASSTPVLSVVPVIVNSPLGQTTYDFLDSGSTHSFISSALFNEVGMNSVPRTHLSLTTVDRDVSVETQAADGVWISDLQGDNQLQLPTLFTL